MGQSLLGMTVISRVLVTLMWKEMVTLLRLVFQPRSEAHHHHEKARQPLPYLLDLLPNDHNRAGLALQLPRYDLLLLDSEFCRGIR